MIGYCINCEREVKYHDSKFGAFHIRFTNYALDVAECVGPFTFSPPPEELPFWSWTLQVPSPDELEAINLVAEELLNDVWESVRNRQ